MSEAVAPKRKVTREEYRALPEGPPYYELIGGELVDATGLWHSRGQALVLLIELLGPYVRHPAGGELAFRPNLYLPGIEDVYHPDLVYVVPKHQRICRSHGIEGAPDVVCEILSSNREGGVRDVKLPQYQRAGVPYVWLIEPEPPVVVEEYVLTDRGYEVRIHTAPAEWEPAAFPGWRLSLAELDAAVAPLGDAE